MKFVLCLSLLVLMAFYAHAQPVDEKHEQDVDVKEQDAVAVAAVTEAQGLYRRQKRATCDLLSAFNVNNSACALHCIARQFKGGYCNNKSVCVCRH